MAASPNSALLPDELGQDTAGVQRRGDIVSERFLACEIGRALARDDRANLVIGQVAQFGDQHMSVDFIG